MKITQANQVVYAQLPPLEIGLPETKPLIPASRYAQRLAALRLRMKQSALDVVVIYGDREHFWNFKYFQGYEPRFEEALLVVTQRDPSYLLLGNECHILGKLSPIPVEAVLCQQFSLPNQPMDQYAPLEELLATAGVTQGKRVGVIGWKMFTDCSGAVRKDLFCVPHFITEAIWHNVGETGQLSNESDILISPRDGIRVVHDADAIVAFEYGAAYASATIKAQQKSFRPGMTEAQLANYFMTNGQVLNLHPFTLAAHNADKGLISPSDYAVRLGDGLNMCYALEGGLSCRHAYAAERTEDLPEEVRDYVEKLVKPYYAAVATWYENMAIGASGGAIYDAIQSVFPKEVYGWTLNTGHLSAIEEWQSSPFYAGSACTIRSGMLLQMDIIPDVPGYHGPNAEDGVCIADEALRAEIARIAPEAFARMQARRAYMIDQIGIELPEEVLPMSNLAAEFRPFMMNQAMGMRIKA